MTYNNNNNWHIVLDMDGTLCHELAPRPHLATFLAYVFDNFATVAIWTAADREWVDEVHANVLKHALPVDKTFDFVWCAERCVIKGRNSGFYYSGGQLGAVVTKPLQKIWKAHASRGMNPHNTLVVDDNESTFRRNYGNAFHIPTFEGDHDDNYLPLLIDFIEKMPKYLSVRTIEKRNWHGIKKE